MGRSIFTSASGQSSCTLGNFESKNKLHLVRCLATNQQYHTHARTQYQKKHSPTHIYPGHQSFFICFLHLLRSTASSLFNLRAWQFFCTISVQVFFGLPRSGTLHSCSIHFFTQSLSSFCSTCPYHCHLFCYSIEIMSSNSSLSLNPLLGTLSLSLMPHIHLTILISAHWSAKKNQIDFLHNMLQCHFNKTKSMHIPSGFV